MSKLPRYIRSREQMFWYVVGKLFELACLLTVLVIVFMHLAGCVTYPPQQYAGIGYMVIEFNEDGDFSRVVSVNGKEARGAQVELENHNGTRFMVSSQEIKAFQGQQARAEVEQTLRENGIEPTDEIIKAILRVVGN